jgi:hypothetical protein
LLKMSGTRTRATSTITQSAIAQVHAIRLRCRSLRTRSEAVGLNVRGHF